MPTYTTLTTLTGKSKAAALGEAMEDLLPEPTGVSVFELDEDADTWEVTGYFVEPVDDVALDLLAAAFGASPFKVEELPETDWIAQVQRDLPPVEAGRFFVYGSHDADKVPDDKVALLIEAAMAFGTGHHGTTLGCLRAFDRQLEQGKIFAKVLDLGAGTAVLAMAAARTTDAQVMASDIDPVAVDVALENLAANGMDGAVTCVESVGFDSDTVKQAAPFDLIFANILKGPLMALADDMAQMTAANGTIILSGLLVEQADAIIARYEGAGFTLQFKEDLGEWSALTLTKA